MIKKMISLLVMTAGFVGAALSLYLLMPKKIGEVHIVPGSWSPAWGYRSFILYENGDVGVPVNASDRINIAVRSVRSVPTRTYIYDTTGYWSVIYTPILKSNPILTPYHSIDQIPLSKEDRAEVKQLTNQLLQQPVQEKQEYDKNMIIIEAYINHKLYMHMVYTHEFYFYSGERVTCEVLRLLICKIATSLPPDKQTPITFSDGRLIPMITQ